MTTGLPTTGLDQPVVLAEFRPYNPALAATVTVEVGTDGFVTAPSDTPANTAFTASLIGTLLRRWDLFEPGRVGGVSRASRGVLTVDNSLGPQGNAQFDDWLDLRWAGREVVVRVGKRGAATLADYAVVFTGRIAAEPRVTRDSLEIEIAEPTERLERDANPDQYSGAGGLGGTADMAGRRVPRLWGQGREVPCVMLVPATQVLQISRGPIQAVQQVCVRGQAIAGFVGNFASLAALEAAAIGPGQYGTCLAQGLVRVGGAIDGPVTADAQGDNTGSYVSTAAAIAERIMLTSGGLVAGDLDAAAFAALAAAQPAVTGIYAGQDQVSCAALLDPLLDGIGAYYTGARDGKITVGRLLAPTAASISDPGVALAIAPCDIEENGIEVVARTVPPTRVDLRFKRFYTVQTTGAALGIGAARLAEIRQEWRTASAATPGTVATEWPDAVPLVLDSSLDASADAATEAARLATLYGASRFVLRCVVVIGAGHAVSLGAQVWLQHPRFGLSAGRALRVIGLAESYSSLSIELLLWG